MYLPESVHVLDSLLNSLRNHKTDLLLQLEQIDLDIAAAERKKAKLCNSDAKLPPELLSYIFLLCQKDNSDFPIIAARVCTRWRDMAFSTRLLWTDIRITLGHVLDVQPALNKMETYISRSGPSALFAFRLRIQDELDFAPVLKVIAGHISRCAYLSVYVQGFTKFSLLFREYLGSLWAPHLGYLALHADFSDRAHNNTVCGPPLIFKAGAPSLKYLRLTSFASGFRPPISGSITTLHLDGVFMQSLTVLQYRGILAANRCLVNLSLQGLTIVPPSDTNSGALELPMLRSLRLRPDEDEPALNKALLNVLPLFCLESLILYGIDIGDLRSTEFPNVKDLSLHWCDFPVSDQMGHLILAFPSLVHLTLRHEFLPLYMALSVRGERIMWPKLRTLCVQHVDDSGVALLRLVQERSNMKCPLEFLCLPNESRRHWAASILCALDAQTNIVPAPDVLEEPWPPGADMDSVDDDNFWFG
ncbi:hypothetical protein EV361DRAFT_903552 [Lentinula raphanica]|uniref:F-box domain-containing protein n=1 Tax=Lentinula raphanica TaxID=153919 RepID=A0AA38UEH5_9AGAR|nr:hypothetical protein F5880DRAFT_1506217 [Lentinula raphanica]KAJ3838634.1 hypothetical protein F5878DRAFT_161941 [Lentinula raphanica]KAJ3972832.1 hypothetical protein EV361DRAFT_903552 [Lentinula raphanica]